MFPVVLQILLSTTPTWSFAVIGDTQSNAPVLTRATAHMRSQRLELGVHLGDVSTCHWNKWMRAVRRKLRSTKIPWYVATGNHDTWECSRYKYVYQLHWTFARFWGRKQRFQHIVHRGKHLVILDSAAYWIPSSNLKKLQVILANAPPKSVFVFLHHPPASKQKFRVSFDGGKRSLKYSRLDGLRYSRNNARLTQMLLKSRDKVLALFHGHHHAYRKYAFLRIPAYCSGGGGGKLETRWDFYHYLIVTVSGNSFQVRVVKL